MHKSLWCAALLGGLWSLPAAAVNTEGYPIPYFGGSGSTLVTDSVRNSDNGQGLQFIFGIPFQDTSRAIELRFFDYGFKRQFDFKKDYQTGLFVDYVMNFGGQGQGWIGSIKPFVSAGVGFIQEDVVDNKHLHFGINAGAGAMIPIPIGGWALRLDGRAQWQANDESYPNTTNTNSPSSLLDYQIGVGLQIPLTLFFDRPVPVAPVEDCPLAVVDPVTGRRDCEVDSDRDGVPDHLDRCPGTSPGVQVDRHGCAPAPVAADDADADSVRDSRDLCPATAPGFRVDANGCVIPQTANVTTVTFEPNLAQLTPEGLQFLDLVSVMLTGQSELTVEIGGHTDNVGSQAYNLLLSQQRAEAVRSYLIEKGIAEDRLTAVGYGQENPLASNATEDGRKTNRRVEFRISRPG